MSAAARNADSRPRSWRAGGRKEGNRPEVGEPDRPDGRGPAIVGRRPADDRFGGRNPVPGSPADDWLAGRNPVPGSLPDDRLGGRDPASGNPAAQARGGWPPAGTPALEVAPGGLARAAADRLAALTARGAGAASAMIHLAEGAHMRLIGGHRLPAGFLPMQQVPVSLTLAGLVMQQRFPLVISDLTAEHRIPAEAPARAVGIRAYAGFPVRDPAGEVVGVCAVMDYLPREWTPLQLAAVDDGAQACTTFVAERRARDAEREQRHFLDTLLNSLETGVAACDRSGRLVIVNRSLAERLGGAPGGTADPADGAARVPVTDPDGQPVDPARVPLMRALRGDQVRGVEQALRLPDGDVRRLRVNAHPITDEEGRRLGAVAVFHDVTEAGRADDLRRALGQAKDEYLNLVGHELRTPLTVIASYLDLLADGDPATPLADSLGMVYAARRGSERLCRLVEALLDLTALDTGRTVLCPADVDLTRVVADAVGERRERAAAKGVTILERLPASLPVRADPDRLTQLVGALVDNAIAYLPPGGAVTVTLGMTGAEAYLEVADDGPGIPDDERPLIFERFFRGAVATEHAVPGAGLGLAMVRLIAERHGGTVTVAPGAGRAGAVFRVVLPR